MGSKIRRHGSDCHLLQLVLICVILVSVNARSKAAASPSPVTNDEDLCRDPNVWPGTKASMQHLDTMPCVSTSDFSYGSVVEICPGETVAVYPTNVISGNTQLTRTRTVLGSYDRESCVPSHRLQRWLTLPSIANSLASTSTSTTVPAIQRWFTGGDGCESTQMQRRVLFYCGDEYALFPQIEWMGSSDDAQMLSTGSPWLVVQPTSTAGAECDGEMHVSVPELCRYLRSPDWLIRYERLLRREPVQSSTVDDVTKNTRAILERGWRDEHERGDMTADRLTELLQSGTQSPNARAVDTTYSFTYGELSTQGGLALCELLFPVQAGGTAAPTNNTFVVYDLGSGFGRITLLFALYGNGVRKSIGLELDEQKHASSVQLLESGMRQKLLTPEEVDRVDFRHGDAFAHQPQASSSSTAPPLGQFHDATHVYMLSTCFGPHIFSRFLGVISPVQTPSLISIVSSRAIPNRLLEFHNRGWNVRCLDVECLKTTNTQKLVDGIARITLVETMIVPTSFSANFKLHIYRVIHTPVDTDSGLEQGSI